MNEGISSRSGIYSVPAHLLSRPLLNGRFLYLLPTREGGVIPDVTVQLFLRYLLEVFLGINLGCVPIIV